MNITTTLRCSLSGLPVGTVELQTTAGTIPYLGHWNTLIVHHPVFSLGEYKLFEFTKKEWKRLAKQAADGEISYAEENILCVSYLAVLHSFGSIRQDQPAMPPLQVVQSTLQQVLALAYWKFYLESKRFKFPTLHICAQNNNTSFADIKDYLELCFKVREDYETKMTDVLEEEKANAAKKAMEALSREWITPVSRKVLWAWVKHYLPAKYDADKVGWMNTLFLGGGNAIVEFEEEDIQMLEEIIVGECPAGTGVMFAVRKRIEDVWKIWKDHHRAFEIDLEDYAVNNGVQVNGVAIQHPHPGNEPTLLSCEGNRTKFIVTIAKWRIAKAAWNTQQATQPATATATASITATVTATSIFIKQHTPPSTVPILEEL